MERLPIEIDLGYGLTPYVDVDQIPIACENVVEMREAMRGMGAPLRGVHFKDNLNLPYDQYVILFDGKPIHWGRVFEKKGGPQFTTDTGKVLPLQLVTQVNRG